MENTQDNLTEKLPPIRVTREMRNELQAIAKRSISNRISDHVRSAIQQYIERQRSVHNN